MKIRFEEIRKIPRGKHLPPETNSFIKDKIPEKMFNDGVGALIQRAELGKWYGSLKYHTYTFKFRYGVCQCFESQIPEGNASFYLNVINPDVDFGRKKDDEGN